MGKQRGLCICIIMSIVLSLTACGDTGCQKFAQNPDLIVYTTLSKEIYEPIIREFENRSNQNVEVREETEEDIINELRAEKDKFPADIVFGMSEKNTQKNSKLFSSSRNFSSSSLVIIYNTNIVTYKELPEDFSSLCKEEWKGKIGFPNPEESPLYQGISEYVADNYGEEWKKYLSEFYTNIGKYADSTEEIVNGVNEGKYSLGVVTEEKAKTLLAQGSNVAYIHFGKKDCTVINTVAITKQQQHRVIAEDFLEFTLCDDVKQYLIEYLSYLPAEKVQRGGEHQ